MHENFTCFRISLVVVGMMAGSVLPAAAYAQLMVPPQLQPVSARQPQETPPAAPEVRPEATLTATTPATPVTPAADVIVAVATPSASVATAAPNPASDIVSQETLPLVASPTLQATPEFAVSPAMDAAAPVPAAPLNPAPVPQATVATSTAVPAFLAGGCVQAVSMPLAISHGITYMTGGTAQEEIEQFRAQDAEFNLQLLFAAKNNDHLVVHSLRILDFKGFELVGSKAVGPYLYAHIPPGDYKLEIINELGAKPINITLKVPSSERLRKTILLK